jgi:4-hydroxybenzoate polyprenyltransferase
MTRQKVIDLLAMSRFANLPTVWSNGLLGVLIGWSAFPDQAHLCPICVTLLGISLSFLYLGGCFFNDWHDLDFDTKTRPDRPIPSGRWPRQTILSLSIILMGGGLALITFISPPAGLFALGILICILAYTKWHKISPASFFFMAGARALIYPTAAFSLLSWNQFTQSGDQITALLILLGVGLGGYILGISLTARAETSKDPISDARKTFPILCLCTPIFFFSAPLLLTKNGSALIPLILFIGILAIIVRSLRNRHNVGMFVSRTLATIPLVDYLIIFPLGVEFIRSGAIGEVEQLHAPNLLVLVACPLLAIAALGLQKIAPAT